MLKTFDGYTAGRWTMNGYANDCRVLLVEDSGADSEHIRGLLDMPRLGRRYAVTECRTLQAATEVLKIEPFDVMLLDLELSESVSLESLSQIHKFAQCPIVVLSALDDEKIAMVAMQNGAQEFMSKQGLDPMSLERMINHSIERHRLMDELAKAKRKAEAASQAKSDFLAVMSHEFRTPMNGILGGINLLGNLCKDPQSLELLGMMKHCAESQLALISDVLDISKIEAGGMELTYGEFSPRDLIASVLSAISLGAREKGLHLAVDIARDLPRQLVSDARRVRQILMNLVGNAVKFTKEGTVRIHVRRIDDRVIEFRVTDTGIGIAEEHLESIFETFTQIDSSYSRRYQGTGLGLAICKRLVKLLGGSIRASSAFGSGSEFRFTIACSEVSDVKAKTDTEISAPSVALQSHPLAVMVVEDNELVRSFLTASLARLGYEAKEAASGSEALALAATRHFDVIFMDIRMPDMDGFETARRLIDEPLRPGELSPFIVAITASISEQIEEQCAAVGIPALLGKPIQAEDLQATLDAAAAVKLKVAGAACN